MSSYPKTYTFLPLLRAPTPSYSITINVAARRLTLFKNGAVFKSYPIAVGKPNDLIPGLNLMFG
jgi:hypothetical protein